MPMAVVDFLQRIYDIFVDYFGASLGVSTLKAQFAIVYQLLDELADYGVPFTTEPNTLRDIVSAPSAVSGFAASMLGQSQVRRLFMVFFFILFFFLFSANLFIL